MTGQHPVTVGAHADERAPTPRRSERGAVTAETAMVLPLIVVVALGLAWLAGAAVAQVRVTDAAREVARAMARDEPQGAALALGRRVAPEGSRISVHHDQGLVVVEVVVELPGPDGIFGFLPRLSASAEAVAAKEAT